MNYKEVLKCLKMPNYVSNDFYSMLFARSIGGAAGYDELTGTPPLTFTANGRNLINYRIYGANDGVGEQTENLCPDIVVVCDAYITRSTDLFTVIKGLTANKNYKISWQYESTGTSGASNQIRLYDANITGIKTIINGDTFSLTTEEISRLTSVYAYFGVENTDGKMSNFMLTEGSTAPAQYIPFGYQINAVVRSENLFDKDAKDTSNGYAVNSYIDSNGDIQFANLYCVSEYMTVEPNQIYYLKDLVTTGTSCNAAFYDTNKSLISTTSVFNVASLTTPPNAIYMRISFYSTLAYKTMVSTTEITTYQPYSRTDIPIYIGDTPLAQGEYVDYGEQKVYKYVGGELTPTDPPVELPALPTIDGTTVADFDNEPKPSEMYIKYPK